MSTNSVLTTISNSTTFCALVPKTNVTLIDMRCVRQGDSVVALEDCKRHWLPATLWLRDYIPVTPPCNDAKDRHHEKDWPACVQRRRWCRQRHRSGDGSPFYRDSNQDGSTLDEVCRLAIDVGCGSCNFINRIVYNDAITAVFHGPPRWRRASGSFEYVVNSSCTGLRRWPELSSAI
ncbi:hypothetical protein P167DRAFT_578858 [Morchella conica CCBAS932]|uniref:Uncharacterized protein n=1 Tax=Morchella conica CCBAS932 TaxID=1392247 RepID=A0A3N4KEY5_9PEZI|nr:hypothetical protein P167DRAFT_578858 [Morchella conica CCBAS932]